MERPIGNHWFLVDGKVRNLKHKQFFDHEDRNLIEQFPNCWKYFLCSLIHCSWKKYEFIYSILIYNWFYILNRKITDLLFESFKSLLNRTAAALMAIMNNANTVILNINLVMIIEFDHLALKYCNFCCSYYHKLTTIFNPFSCLYTQWWSKWLWLIINNQLLIWILVVYFFVDKTSLWLKKGNWNQKFSQW